MKEKRPQANINDLKVYNPEFEGKLYLDDLLEWMHTIKVMFDFRKIPEEKKVKLLTLKLRKYASLWWTDLYAKRLRQRKEKIRTWDKMKSKLKSEFLPPFYLQDYYSQLHDLTRGTISIEEYMREFEKLVIKYD